MKDKKMMPDAVVTQRDTKIPRTKKLGAYLCALLVFISVIAAPLRANADEIVDPNTSGDVVADALNTQKTGQVLTDKSVTGTGNNSFNVTLSALSAAQSGTDVYPVARDVVFVLDTSGSMTNYMSGGARYKVMVDTVNETIKTIAKANPENRVAIVGYSGPVTNDEDNTTILTPLSTPSTTQNALTAGDGYIQSNKSGAYRYTQGGTDTQVGLYAGMNLLMSNSDTATELDGRRVPRSPMVVLVSDGAPTFSASNSSYGGANWISPSGANGSGQLPYSGNGFMTLMTASYMKKSLDDHYGVLSSTKTQVFTVGVGTDGMSEEEQQLAAVTLNPKDNLETSDTQHASNMRAYWDKYQKEGSVTVEIGQSRYADNAFTKTSTVRKVTDANAPTSLKDLKYNDAFYTANDKTQLQEAMKSIAAAAATQDAEYATGVSGATSSGDPNSSGYVTFTDTTGDFMQVKLDPSDPASGPKITYNGQEYACTDISPKTTTASEYTLTYEAEVEGNASFAETNPGQKTNLNHLIVKVKRGSGSTGDTVTFQIPQALIPQSVVHVQVSGSGYETTLEKKATPIQLNYEVQLKPGVEEGLKDPSTMAGLQNYIDQNSTDGKVRFYANKFTKGSAAGDAKAVYQPAANNPYYTYRYDQIIYSDSSLSNPVSITPGRFNANTTYYIAQTYYENGQKRVEAVPVKGSALNKVQTVKGNDGSYIVAGQPHVDDSVSSGYEQTKTQNPTETATNVSTLGWNSASGEVTNQLGNNGRLELALPGKVALTKNVTADDGITPPNTSFQYIVHLTDESGQPLTGKYKYSFTSTSGATQGGGGTLGDGDSVYLQAGQTVTIEGIPSGAHYELEEVAAPGWSIEQQSNTQGTIVAQQTQNASYTNKYSVQPTKAEVGGIKELTGRDSQAGEKFTFTLEGKDQATKTAIGDGTITLPTTSVDVSDLKNGVSKEFSFGELTFTKPGEYNFILKETPGSAGGMRYDTHEAYVTVTVQDDGQGNLVASVKYSDDGKGQGKYFSNVYTAQGIQYQTPQGVHITKTLNGRASQAGQFSLTVTPKNSTSSDKFAGGEFVNKASADGVQGDWVNGAGKTIDAAFGDMLFNQDDIGKVYEWDIQETTASAPGYTNDNTTHHMSVSVSDNGDGTLNLTTTIDGKQFVSTPAKPVRAELNITNEYNANGKAQIKATKTLNGMNADAGAFSFKITDSKGNQVATATSPSLANGTPANIAFPEINYTTDSLQQDVTNGIAVKGDDGNGNATYTYTYTAQEDTSHLPAGVTATQASMHFKVVVTDAGNGTYTATVTYPEGDHLSFINTYATNSVTKVASGIKTLNVPEGVTAPDITGKFSFTITGEAGAPLPSKTTVTNDGQGNVNFGDITFDLASLQGQKSKTFTYTVKETGSVPGVTNDPSASKTFTVTVTDNGSGQLSVTTDPSNPPLFEFTNTYNVAPTQAELKGSKVLAGRNSRPGEAFDFTLSVTDPKTQQAVSDGSVVLPSVTTQQVTNLTNNVTKDFSFGNVQFKKAGVYKFDIAETKGNIQGITYDTHVATAVVTVTDDGAGNLVASVVYTDDGAGAGNKFTNKYGASANYGSFGGINVTKQLNGRDIEDGQFSFNVVAGDTDSSNKFAGGTYTSQAGSAGTPTVVKNASGETLSQSFGKINFTQVDAGKDFTWTVTETNPSGSGYTNDTTKHTITVHVDDNGDGSLTLTTRVDSQPAVVSTTDSPKSASLNIVNTYEAQGTIVPLATKTLNGRDLNKGEFKFTVLDSIDQEIANGTNEAAAAGQKGTVTLSDFVYTSTKLQEAVASGRATKSVVGGKQTYTFKYTAKELTSNLPAGVTADVSQLNFTVVVTDNGDGTLTPVVEYPNGATSLDFVNSYKVNDVTTKLQGKKVLNSADGLTPQDITGKFSFTITADDGGPLPQNTTVTNQNNGTVDFGNLTFKLADLGGAKTKTFTYTITETGSLAGVTNDPNASYKVQVTLTDNGNGTLSVTTNPSAAPYFTFTNTYEAQPVTSKLQANKDLMGRDSKPGETFSFTLAADNTDTNTAQAIASGAIVMPGNTQASVSDLKNSTIKSTEFDDIQFTKPGTYKFVITENLPAGVSDTNLTKDGLTYDNHKAYATVKVIDNGAGQLIANVTYSDEGTGAGNTFTNIYSTDNSGYRPPQGIHITKTLQGHDMQAGQFAIKVTPKDPESATKFAGGTFTNQAAAAGQQAAWVDSSGKTVDQAFGMDIDSKDINKTYEWTVQETTVASPGYTNDNSEHTVRITITDNGDGTLKITTLVDGKEFVSTQTQPKIAQLNITNEYNAQGDFTPKATKTLNGRNANAGEFNFTITDSKGRTVGTAQNIASNAGQPGALGFPAIHYDSDSLAQAVEDGAATKSTVNGKPTYTFVYNAQEDTSNLPDAVTATAAAFQFTVTVTDNGNGTLSIQASYPDSKSQVEFVNTYAANDVPKTISGVKKLSGASGLTLKDIEGKFSFTLSSDDPAAPLPDTTKVTNDAQGNVKFGDITYKLSDLGGATSKTFTYKVKETGTVPGVTNDPTSVKTFTVTLTDDGHGNLVVTTDPTNAPFFEFTNSYSTSPATVSLEGTKQLNGRDSKTGEGFAFNMTAADDATTSAISAGTVVMPSSSKTSVTGLTNGVEKSFSFGGITINAPGTYKFNISEEKGTVGGITYDTHVATATVVVRDDGQGHLSASVSYTDDGSGTGNKFVNTYAAHTTYGALGGANVTKQLNGHDLAHEQFEFNVVATNPEAQAKFAGGTYHSNDAPANTPSAIHNDDTNQSLSQAFGEIVFTQDDAGKDFVWTVTEQNPSGDGYTNDTTTHTITVHVNDDGQGNLSTTTTIDSQAPVTGTADNQQTATLNIINSYAAQGDFTPVANKTLHNKALDNEAFDFEIKDASGTVVATGKNAAAAADAQGAISFDTIHYTTADLEQAVANGNAVKGTAADGKTTYTFTYTAQEKTDALPAGVVCDTPSLSFRVVVTDNGDGTLSATATYPDGSSLEFSNTYQVQDVKAPIKGKKVLSVPAGLSAHDITGAFTFTITADDGGPLPAQTQVKNASDGTVDFGEITYKLSDLGGAASKDFTYTITESGSAGGVTNDANTYKVVVHVADDGQGHLTVTTTPTSEPLFTFTNTYNASPATTTLEADKTLNGRNSNPGESFEFNMVAGDSATTAAMADGSVTLASTKQTVDNLVDGEEKAVSFGNATFTKPGTYTFKITEKLPSGVDADNPAKDGMTYDVHTAIATVVVTDDGHGQLQANVTYSDDGSHTANHFTNTYVIAPINFQAHITKTLNGHDMEPGQFSFTVAAQDAETRKKYAGGMFTNPAGEDGQAATLVDSKGQTIDLAFNSIKFGTADIGKTFTWKVTETTPAAPGYTNDNSSHTITVTVLDNNNGTLSLQGTVDGRPFISTNENPEPATLNITNSYKAMGQFTPQVTKTLNGRDMKDGEFSFILKDAKGTTLGKATSTAAKNGEAGAVNFPEIHYSTDLIEGFVKQGLAVEGKDSLGRPTYTFTYNVYEDTSALPESVTATTPAYSFQVVVTDMGDGTMQATPVYPDSKDQVEFVNTYATDEVPVNILGLKNLQIQEGRTPDSIEGKFSFTISANDGGPLPALTTVRNDAAGNVDFGPINFTLDDLDGQTSKTFSYTVRETGSAGGVTNDPEATKTFSITVTDDGKGHLTATTSPELAPYFTFNNSYSTKPVNALFGGDKTLAGRDAPEGATFTYTISPDSDVTNKAIQDGDIVMPNNKASVTVYHDGQAQAFNFDEITFNEPGEYRFKFTEDLPAGVTALQPEKDGISYDTHTTYVTAIVTDNGNGQLVVSYEYADDGNAKGNHFTNKYVVNQTYNAVGGINVTKTLNGRDMTDKQFAFTVVGADDASTAKFAGGSYHSTAAQNGQPAQLVNDTANADGTFSTLSTDLGKISFTNEDSGKDFIWKVTETTPATDGYTNDNSEHTIKLHVSDNHDGTLSITTQIDDQDPVVATTSNKVTPNLNITNTYNATGNVIPTATKQLNGQAQTDGEFNFTITDKLGNTVATATNKGGAADTPIAFDFTQINYDSAMLAQAVADGTAIKGDDGKGHVTYTFNYKATENTSSMPAGISPTKSSFDFTVVVTDNGDGTLTCTPNYPAGTGLGFVNTYDTNAADLPLAGKKVLSIPAGLTPKDVTGAFSFVVTAPTGTPMPEDTTVTNASDGSVNFGNIHYTLADLKGQKSVTFTYTITESGSVPGFTNDANNPQTVQVTLTDDGQGHLSVTVNPTTAPYFKFTNAYSVQDETHAISDDIRLNKVLNGRPLQDGEFQFQLVDGRGQVVATGTNDAAGNIEMTDITYTKPGEYHYTLKEVKGSAAGVTYTDQTFGVTVKVVDNGDGTLQATATIDNASGDPLTSATFTNTYTPVPTAQTFQGSKKLIGRNALQNEDFTFDLAAADDATRTAIQNGAVVMPTDTTAVVRGAQNNVAQNFSFGEVTFNKAGTYTFNITERGGSAGGMTYDTHTLKAIVTVTDNGDGTLSSSIRYEGSQEFDNVYKATANYGASGPLKVDKQVAGRNATNGQFTLEVKPGDADSTAKFAGGTFTNWQIMDGEIGPWHDAKDVSLDAYLAGLNFTQDDAGKTFTWSFTETTPSGSGWVCDNTKHIIQVRVIDNGDGTLSISTKIDSGMPVVGTEANPHESDLIIKNTYAAQGSFTPEATKTLHGRDDSQVGSFKFTITDAKGNVVGTASSPTLTNNTPGAISFPAIQYTSESIKDAVAAGIAKDLGTDSQLLHTYEFTYTATEDTSNLPAGVTADTNKASFTFTVRVHDNGDGTYTVTPNYPAGGGLAFSNTYTSSPATASVAGKKELNHLIGLTPNDITGRFNFTITADDGGPLPSNPTVTNAADGSVNFGSWNFTQANMGGAMSKDFHYTVTESGSVPGVTNDTNTTRKITVHVTDDGQGHLSASVDPAGLQFTFTNTYSVQPAKSSVTDQIQVTKRLTGKALKAGEFTFHVMEGSVEVATATNDATGKVVFPQITYTEPGVHQYTIVEENTGETGVTYDQTRYNVLTTVIDNGDGTMTVTHALQDVTGKLITFENSYTPEPCTAAFDGTKKLVGRDSMANEDFIFQMAAADTTTQNAITDGNVVLPNSTTTEVTGLTNGVSKGFTFDDVTFKKAGTYKFNITERNTGTKGLAFDSHTLTATVVVTDDGQGHLSAQVTYTGAQEFVNTYSAAADYGPTGPLKIAKQLLGHDAPAGAFQLEVTPKDEATKDKFAGGTFGNGQVQDGKLVEWYDSTNTSLDTYFANVHFTQDDAGKTFVWYVQETGTATAGYVHDTARHTIAVSVIDNHDGTLTISTKIDDGYAINGTLENPHQSDLVIKNTYTAQGDFTPEATKTLHGRDMVQGEFRFKITDKLGHVVGEATNAAAADGQAGTIGFPTIHYTTDSIKQAVADGTATDLGFDNKTNHSWQFDYTATEVTDSLPGGVSADAGKSSFDFSVIVYDNGDGTYTATAKYPGGGLAFSNTYATNSAPVNIAGKKVLAHADGLNAPDITGKYQFQITADDGGPLPSKTTVTNGADGSVDFGGWRITQDMMGGQTSKDFHYTITEVGSVTGVTNDPETQKHITVHVTDDGQGHLNATVSPASVQFTFTNTYAVSPIQSAVTDQIQISKELTGRPLQANEFNFDIYEGNVKVGTAQNDGAGNVVFPKITYDKPGVHNYTITEAKGALPGITYDGNVYHVTTTVTDNGDGTMSVTHKLTDASGSTVNAIVFRNSYTPSPVMENLEASKVINGRDTLTGGTFQFNMTPADSATNAAISNGTIVMPVDTSAEVGQLTDGQEKSFSFDAITFKKTGTYKFNITEVNDGVPGLIYDNHTCVATVTVTDNGSGQLSTSVSYEGGQLFTNTYRASENYSAVGGINITKTLYGNGGKDSTFTLDVTPKDPESAAKFAGGQFGNYLLDDGQTVGWHDASNTPLNMQFGNIRFTEQDAGKTFTWTVQERDKGVNGLVCDTQVHTVSITVSDLKDGHLKLTTTIDGNEFEATAATPDTPQLAIINRYSAKGDFTPKGSKMLYGRDESTPGTFNFEIRDKNGNLVGTSSSPALTNGVAEPLTFPTIHYTTESLKADAQRGNCTVNHVPNGNYTYTYEYTAREITSNLPAGVTAQPSHDQFKFTVVVEDDNDGEFNITVSYPDGEEKGLDFINVYNAQPNTAEIKGIKVLNAANGLSKPDIAGKYTFTITGEGNAPMPANLTVKNAADGTVDFGSITYKFSDLGGASEKTFVYHISESGSVPGVVNDANNSKTVRVTVRDNGDGTLSVITDPAAAPMFQFDNVYKVSPTGSAISDQIEVTKDLAGRTLNAGEFQFQVLDERNQVVATGTNDGTGHVTFTPITYTEPGQHTYRVVEVEGSLPGVTYSKQVYTVKTSVTDNGDGTLGVTHVLQGATNAVFNNTYTSNAGAVDLKATKNFVGRDMKPGESFNFQMAAADKKTQDAITAGDISMPANTGATVSGLTNNTPQEFSFQDITFKKAGVYTFNITENVGSIPGVAYDSHTCTATVTVTDDGLGNLSATVSYAGGQTFTNTYSASTTYAAVGSVDVKKQLNGRDQQAGQFQFNVTPVNDESKAKFTGGAYVNEAGADGTKTDLRGVTSGKTLNEEFGRIQFTQADAGKDFAWDIIETTPDGNGYTNDNNPHRVRVHVEDTGNGTLAITTTIDSKPGQTSTPDAPKTPEVLIVNNYAAQGGFTPQVTKTLLGRAAKDGEFNFKITNNIGYVVSTGTNQASADGEEKAINFSDITYTTETLKAAVSAGVATKRTDTTTHKDIYTFTYTVAEDTTNLPGGVTAQRPQFTFTVDVVDNGDGTLSCNPYYPADGSKIVNKYSANDVRVPVEGHKILSAPAGITPPDFTRKFTFTITSDDPTAPMPTTTTVNTLQSRSDETGVAQFGDIVFTLADLQGASEKTFVYHVTETGSMPGVTNDPQATKDFSITVRDDGKGHLSVYTDPSAAPYFTFVNTYNVAPANSSVTDQINVNKQLIGRNLQAGEFNFQLTENGRVVATGTNDASGNVTMSPINYTEPGDHIYQLTEVKGSAAGVSYDATSYQVIAHVVDDGKGNLKVTYTASNPDGTPTSNVVFNNTYSAQSTTVRPAAEKLLNGRDSLTGETFDFVLETADANTAAAVTRGDIVMPSKKEVSVGNLKNGQAQGFEFGDIVINKPGDYTFKITEKPGSAPGMVYDNRVLTVTVHATDIENGSHTGQIAASVTYSGGSKRFINTYSANNTYGALGGVKVAKVLYNHDLADKKFQFNVTPDGDDAKNKFAGGTYENVAAGAQEPANLVKQGGTSTLTDDFGKIVFTQDDAGKTYRWYVQEQTGNYPGYTCDTAQHVIEVQVIDNHDGTLSTITSVDGKRTQQTPSNPKAGVLTIENRYSSHGSFQPKATKILTGRDMAAGEFNFDLYLMPQVGDPQKLESGKNVAASAGQEGEISLAPRNLDNEYLEMLYMNDMITKSVDASGNTVYTLNYQIVESGTLPSGVTAVTKSENIKVTVTDMDNGKLDIRAEYQGGKDHAILENTYNSKDAQVAVKGMKNLAAPAGANPPDITGKFTFTISSDTPGAPMPTKTTTTNDSAGNVDFGKITFTKADLDGQMYKDFTYTITESGSVPGVVNDTQTHRFQVRVVDNGLGQLVITTNPSTGNAFIFNNVYQPEPVKSTVIGTADDQLHAKKRLIDKYGNEVALNANQFRWVLKDANGAFVCEGTNDAQGNVVMQPITYTKPGTYNYTLTEVDTGQSGITYDKATYNITTVVTDNGDGTMSVTHTYTNGTDTVTFTNKFEPEPYVLALGATKSLSGRTQNAGEFQFSLDPANAEARKVLPNGSVATNMANGSVQFQDITIDTPGTYKFTITERNTGLDGITYDTNSYGVTVKVVDTGTGLLQAEITYDNGNPDFKNKYDKAQDPSSTPLTGTILGGTLPMTLSGGVLGTGLIPGLSANIASASLNLGMPLNGLSPLPKTGDTLGEGSMWLFGAGIALIGAAILIRMAAKDQEEREAQIA